MTEKKKALLKACLGGTKIGVLGLGNALWDERGGPRRWRGCRGGMG